MQQVYQKGTEEASRAFSEHYGVRVEVVTSTRPLVTPLLGG